MDVTLELDRIVGGKQDGWWGLVATALGHAEASRGSMAGLSREALIANYDGPANSPTIVEHRIQALAAHDQLQLVRLSRGWKSVTEIALSVMDPEADFWLTAWRASLRFLKNQGAVTSIPEAALPEPLGKEFRVLFTPGAPVTITSWQEARHRLLIAGDDYDEIRRLDAAEVQFAQIGRSELVDLLSPDQSGQLRMERLRFFFGRGRLIGGEGRSYLEHLVEERWESLHQLGTTPSGFTVLVDLVLELAGPARSSHRLYNRLMSSLATLETPQRLLPLVYLALQKGWRHP